MRKVLVLIAGVAAGVAAAYVVSQRKEEIIKKLNEIQGMLKDMELRDKAKNSINDVVQKVKKLISKGEELTIEEKEKMLSEIEEKIHRLEEAIKG